MALITKDSPKIATDKLPFFVQLMPHQKAIIYEMLMVEDRIRQDKNRYAMMSDKPGAGKTFAILGFIYFSDKVVFARKKERSVNLIVVPYNICTQWKDSMIRLFGPSERVLNYKVLLEYADVMKLYVNTEELLGNDIILTTSLYFDNIANTLKSLKIKLRRVFFDEADTIKNLLQTPLLCDMTWFVSASMESLFTQNSEVTIGNYKLYLNHLKTNDVKCDVDFINDNIILDPPMVHKIDITNAYYTLLRDVTDLSCHDDIRGLDYKCLRSEFVSGFDGIDNEYKACKYVLEDLHAKFEYAEHQIKVLKPEYEELIKKDKKESAKEVRAMIERYGALKEDCDRKIGVFKYFASRYDIDDTFSTMKEELCDSKLERIKGVIDDIITRNPKAQCIVFTNYDQVYSILKTWLQEKRYRYRYLDGGNIRDMDNIIESYKRREFSVLLADSSMYSCGMNLENTSDIIFIHRMNEQREKQVIGRALRYGREGVLNIWFIEYK